MSDTTPPLPEGVQRVRERRTGQTFPRYVVPGWQERFPWLVHGTTAGGTTELDLGLFREGRVGDRLDRWCRLREEMGMARAVHARQVHGRTVIRHEEGPPGLFIATDADGHATDRAGILLTVAVADCVPISLVRGHERTVALLHGGWRGTAAGIIAAGLGALGGDPRSVTAHLGPAICGRCYEVGPEVHEALGLGRPDAPCPVDVRAVQARRLVAAGVAAAEITVSDRCTRCGEGLFSHRGGSTGRQLGLLGIR